MKKIFKIKLHFVLLAFFMAAASIYSAPATSALPFEYEEQEILHYNPDLKQQICGANAPVGASVAGSCSSLAESRTAMWNASSATDKLRFMNVVSKEDYGLAAVEAYMNQIISKRGNDGSLANWLNGQCVKFMAGGAAKCATAKSELTSQDQSLIDMALGGSNVTRYAIGNATGGSSVGAGTITCVWKQDSSKPELGYCRDDVDLSGQTGGQVPCSKFSPSAGFGECWGLEGEDAWAKKMEESCGSTSTPTPQSNPPAETTPPAATPPAQQLNPSSTTAGSDSTNCSAGAGGPGSGSGSFDGDFATYAQCDSRWGNIKYSLGNFCSSACGVVSTAMIISTLKKKEVTPDAILSQMRAHGAEVVGSGTSIANAAKMMEAEYGLKTESLGGDLRASINRVLDSGGFVIAGGRGGKPYTGGGHVVVIYQKLPNGQLLIGDPIAKNGATIEPPEIASVPEKVLQEHSYDALIGGTNGMWGVYAN